VKRLLLQIDGEPSDVRVEGDRFHYLARVLRVQEGEALEVFDGAGRSFPAKVVRLEADAAQLSLGPPQKSAQRREWILLQGLPKGDKLELILQKTTELGVTVIAPVAMERSVVKLSPDKAADRLTRWSRIAEEAARQCGRSEVPRVEPLRRLPEAIGALPEQTQVFVLDEEEKSLRLGEAFLSRVQDASQPVALVIGPEGGVARDELELLRKRGALGVSLGERILRTETAGLAALAVLQHLDGELG